MPVLSTFKPTGLPTASPTNHPDHLQYIISLSFFVTLIYILILLIFLFIRRKNIAQQQQQHGYIAQHAMIRFCNQNRCTFILTTDFDSIIQASLGKRCKFFLGLSRFIYFVCFTFMFALLNDQEGIKGWAMYYFTNWTILLVAIYFFLSFISSFIAIYLKSIRNPYEASLNLEIEWSCTMRCLGVIIHQLYEVAGASSCFALVFDYIFMNSNNNSMILTFARIVTVTSLILELLMNNIDVRFDQYPATAAFLMIYFLFIWPEVSFGHLDDWPYEILSASSINCYGYYLIVFILNFIFYCVWYTLYIVKRELYIYYDIGRIAAQEYDYQHVEDEEADGGSVGGGGGFRLTDTEVQSIGINESVIYIENSTLYDDTTTTTTFDYLNTIVFDESNQMYEKDFESSSPLHDDSDSWIKAEHVKNISSYNNNDNKNYDLGLNIAVPILSPVDDVGKKNKSFMQAMNKVANKAKTSFVTTNSPIHIHHSVNTTSTTTTKSSSVSVSSVLNGLITLEQVRKRSSSEDNYHDAEHNGHMVMKASSSAGDYHQSNHHSASNLVNRFNMNRGISSSSSLSSNIIVSSVFDQNDYDKNHHHDNYHEDYHHDNYDFDDAMMGIIPPNDAIFTNKQNINIHEKAFENDISVNTTNYVKYDNKGNDYQNNNNDDDDDDVDSHNDIDFMNSNNNKVNYNNHHDDDVVDDISSVLSKRSNNSKTNHNFFGRINNNVMSDKVMMMTTSKKKSTKGLELSQLQLLSGIAKKPYTFPLDNDDYHHHHQQQQQQLHHADELEHAVFSGKATTSSLSSSYTQAYFDFNYGDDHKSDNNNNNEPETYPVFNVLQDGAVVVNDAVFDDNHEDRNEATHQANYNNNNYNDNNNNNDDDNDSFNVK